MSETLRFDPWFDHTDSRAPRNSMSVGVAK